jgi:hypothetical protein
LLGVIVDALLQIINCTLELRNCILKLINPLKFDILIPKDGILKHIIDFLVPEELMSGLLDEFFYISLSLL